MIYLFVHPSGSQVFLSRNVIETVKGFSRVPEGFSIASETTSEGDLISVIVESENLSPSELEILDRHYERVIQMMESSSHPSVVQPEEMELS